MPVSVLGLWHPFRERYLLYFYSKGIVMFRHSHAVERDMYNVYAVCCAVGSSSCSDTFHATFNGDTFNSILKICGIVVILVDDEQLAKLYLTRLFRLEVSAIT
jgi:hypothetical protein